MESLEILSPAIKKINLQHKDSWMSECVCMGRKWARLEVGWCARLTPHSILINHSEQLLDISDMISAGNVFLILQPINLLLYCPLKCLQKAYFQ